MERAKIKGNINKDPKAVRSNRARIENVEE